MKYGLNIIIKLPILIFSLTCCFFAEAQYVIKSKIGITLSRVKEPTPDFYYYQPSHQVPKIGLEIGTGIEYDLNPFLSAEADLLYTQKGLKDTTHVSRFNIYNDYDKGHTYRFHYIELPLLIHLKVDNHLKLGVGPSLSHLIKAQYFLGSKKKNNTNINYSNFDFGLLADASWTTKRFETGARFTYGISKVDFVSKYYDPEFPSAANGIIGKNRTFQFYINYLIKK